MDQPLKDALAPMDGWIDLSKKNNKTGARSIHPNSNSQSGLYPSQSRSQSLTLSLSRSLAPTLTLSVVVPPTRLKYNNFTADTQTVELDALSNNVEA